MPSVLGTSVPPSVGTLGKTAIVSMPELIGWEVLVPLRLGAMEDAGSVLNHGVSEEPGIDVGTVVSLRMEEVTVAKVTLDGSESAGTGECVSCPELVDPTLVTAVFLER